MNVVPYGPVEDWPRDAAGAFVHVLAIARSEIQFKELASKQLFEDGFMPIEWDQIATFDLAVNDWHQERAQEAHARLSEEWPVQYVTFHAYPKDDLDG